jgi:hypothetical protein
MQSVNLGDLSLPVLVALAALVVADLSVRIFALVQLLKTPPERVTLGGRKWAWALIIALVNTAGWILWFVLGRRPAGAQGGAAGPADKIEAAADLLYPEPPRDLEHAPAIEPPPSEPSPAIWDGDQSAVDDARNEPR